MRHPVLITLLAALLATPAAARGDPPPPAPPGDAPLLTLADAIDQAIAGNRALAGVREETAKARARVAAGRTRRWPAVDLRATAGQLLTPVDFTLPAGFLGVHPVLGPFPAATTEYAVPRRPTATVTATLAQPLSQQFRIGLALAQGRLGERAADLQAESAERTLVLNVRRAYHAIAQTDAALQSALESLAAARELDRLVRSYAAEQALLPADALDASARLAQQEQAVTALHHTRANQQEQLNLLLGRGLTTTFTVEPAAALPTADVDVDTAVAHALAHRADIAQARLRQQQADLDVRLTRAQRIPDVSLAVTYASTANIDLVPQQIAIAGVLVAWEPWTWGRRRHETDEKQATARQAATAVRDAEEQVRLDVRARVRRVQDARALVPVARQAEAAARERLRVATAKFAEQAALLRDVLQFQEALATATLRHEQARLAYWVAHAELLDAMADGRTP